jgi:hypothetical protein
MTILTEDPLVSDDRDILGHYADLLHSILDLLQEFPHEPDAVMTLTCLAKRLSAPIRSSFREQLTLDPRGGDA